MLSLPVLALLALPPAAPDAEGGPGSEKSARSAALDACVERHRAWTPDAPASWLLLKCGGWDGDIEQPVGAEPEEGATEPEDPDDASRPSASRARTRRGGSSSWAEEPPLVPLWASGMAPGLLVVAGAALTMSVPVVVAVGWPRGMNLLANTAVGSGYDLVLMAGAAAALGPTALVAGGVTAAAGGGLGWWLEARAPSAQEPAEEPLQPRPRALAGL